MHGNLTKRRHWLDAASATTCHSFFFLFSVNIQALRFVSNRICFSQMSNYMEIFTMYKRIYPSRLYIWEARVADENRLGPNRAEGKEPTPTASSIRLAPRKAGRRMWEHHLPPLTPRPITRDAPTHYYTDHVTILNPLQQHASSIGIGPIFQRRIKVTPFKLIRISLVPSNPFSRLF